MCYIAGVALGAGYAATVPFIETCPAAEPLYVEIVVCLRLLLGTEIGCGESSVVVVRLKSRDLHRVC